MIDPDILRVVVEAILGCTTLISFILYYKQTKRVKNAEALQAEIESDKHQFDLYKAQLEHCSDTIDKHNETIKHQSETISTLNTALDDKTERIRVITDKLYESEREVNKVNDKLIDATEQIGKLNLKVDKLSRWKCIKGKCMEREPESPTIQGKIFEEDV